MAYSNKFVSDVKNTALTEGNKLGRHAIRLNFPVIKIAKATGATRQTVYNWFLGKPIAPYYAERVGRLFEILSSAETAEHAWRETCLKFDLKT